MATLGSLVVELGANVGKLQSDMNKAVGVVDRASAGIRRAATVAATALGAIGAGLTLSTITGAARQVIDLGDKLRDLSFATGQSVEQLSFLEFAAGQSGTSIDAISSAAARLSKNLLEVANGGGENAARALRRLGLSAVDLSRLDLVSQFERLGAALREVQNPSERAALGAAVLGRQFRELAPLILDNEEGFGRLVDRFIELNGTITGAQGDLFDSFNDSLGELRLAARGASEAIATALAPALTGLFETAASTIPNIVPFFTDSFFAIREIILDASRAVQRSKLDFLELFEGLGSSAVIAKIEATRDRIAQITEEIKLLRQARDDVILDRADSRRTERAAITQQITNVGLEVDPEAAAKAAEKASKEAQRAADALQRESDAVRDFLQDYARDREKAFSQEVEQSRQRMEAMREAIRTPRERALAELAEFEKAFGANSEEYGRKAVEVFNELNVEIEATSTAARDLGLTFVSAFEDAIVEGEALSDVLKGLAQDVLRVLVRETVTNPLTDAVQGLFQTTGKGGLSGFFSSIFGGFRANGGPVMPGKAYVVGERGPELLVPATAGTVVPGGGGVTVNVIGAPSQPTVRERSSNGRRQIDLVFADAAGSATAGGMLAPLGIRPPLVAR